MVKIKFSIIFIICLVVSMTPIAAIQEVSYNSLGSVIKNNNKIKIFNSTVNNSKIIVSSIYHNNSTSNNTNSTITNVTTTDDYNYDLHYTINLLKEDHGLILKENIISLRDVEMGKADLKTGTIVVLNGITNEHYFFVVKKFVLKNGKIYAVLGSAFEEFTLQYDSFKEMYCNTTFTVGKGVEPRTVLMYIFDYSYEPELSPTELEYLKVLQEYEIELKKYDEKIIEYKNKQAEAAEKFNTLKTVGIVLDVLNVIIACIFLKMSIKRG